MQPCSQPRYGLIERSKEISGELLRVMILRVESRLTLVLNGGNSSKFCQPSSNAMRARGSYRPDALDCAPRPRRRSRATEVSRSSGWLRSVMEALDVLRAPPARGSADRGWRAVAARAMDNPT